MIQRTYVRSRMCFCFAEIYDEYEKNNHRLLAKTPPRMVQYTGRGLLAVTPLKGILTMKYDFSRLGENIAALRRAAGLTQELLADRLGVTSQAVSKWERQLSCPDVSLLPAMADVFGVSIDELFVSADTDHASRIDALPWEDDGRVRIAVFEGKHLCAKEVYECPDGEEMVLLIRHEDGRHALPFGAARPTRRDS